MGNADESHESSLPAGAISVHTDERSGAVLVAVAGEVDIVTAPRLRAAVDDALARLAGRTLVLDLSGVTFFGSQGLHILAATATRVREAGGAAGLRVVATRVALRPIQITGLDVLIRLYETAEETLDD